MKIESYSFGRMVIAGTVYTSDLIIYPERVDASWWRGEGHRLQLKDLETVLAEKPEVLVIGTGYSGELRVPADLIETLKSSNLGLQVAPTARAVEIFNALWGKKKTIGAFHLTC